MSRSTTPTDGAIFVAGASTKSDNVSAIKLADHFKFEFNSVDLQTRLLSMKRFLAADLTAHLGKEWPASFCDTFYDDRGFLVAEFDFPAASAEGDLLGYMNKLVCSRQFSSLATISSRGAKQLTHIHPRYNKLDDGILANFKLKRDVRTWGAVTGERVLFAWRPPWVKPSLVELYYNSHDASAAKGSADSEGSPSCLKKLRPERESMLFTERSKRFGRVKRSPIGLPFRGPLLCCAMGFD